MATFPRAGNTRFHFLDAARSAAMLFYLLVHFGAVYFRGAEHHALRGWLERLGMIATPTFVLISGVLLGALYHHHRDDFARSRNKTIDRGLFLVLVGHVLVCLPLLRLHDGPWLSASTDAIGAAMIAGALLVPRVSATDRLLVSVAAYAWSWAVVYSWMPHGWHGHFVKEALFGSLTPHAFHAGTFPFVPWTAVYLAGSVVGERLAQLRARDAVHRAVAELAALGTAGVGLMTAVKLAAWQAGVSPLWGAVTSPLLRLGQKYPPSPLYLLFYGGIGLLILAACLLADHDGWARRAFALAAQWGEASFFIYIVHYYVFWLGIYELGPGGPAMGIVYFAASLALLLHGANVWRRHEGNRLLTVGFGWPGAVYWRALFHRP